MHVCFAMCSCNERPGLVMDFFTRYVQQNVDKLTRHKCNFGSLKTIVYMFIIYTTSCSILPFPACALMMSIN